jgi:hypothetical protein
VFIESSLLLLYDYYMANAYRIDAIGSGPGIIIAVSTLHNYYEIVKEEVGSRPKASKFMALLGL